MNEDISQDEIQAQLRERFSVSPVTLSCGVPELTSAQRTCLAHAVRILSDRRAVLLCEPTGTGKTYIAAALADYALHHGMADAVQIIGPAHLASLWLGVMAQFRIPSVFFSYQMASLDRIPLPKKRTLFLLDEAHYLKNAHTRRYRNLRRTLYTQLLCLISATPVSMGYADLEALMRLCGLPEGLTLSSTQLRLFSMALMPRYFGLPLTLDMPDATVSHHVCFLRYADPALVGAFLEEIQKADWPVFGELDKTNSSLIPRILIHRFLSHPVSCRMTLRKLRRYYAQCLKTGALRPISRAEFRNLFGLDGIQLPLPFGIPNDHAPTQDTLRAVDRINAELTHLMSMLDKILSGPDPVFEVLRDILEATPTPTVIFTQYVDTARHVASLLRKIAPTACLTASTATFNGYAVDREIIQNVFDPHAPPHPAWQNYGIPPPRILVASDTLATGHNLQVASRLIHLDIPWNPTTVRQREGRILRHHQQARRIDFYRMELDGIHALADFQKNFWDKFESRQKIQDTWTSPASLTEKETFLFSPVRQTPGFWLLCQDTWLPVYPFCSAIHRMRKVGPLVVLLQNCTHPSEGFAQQLLSHLKRQRFCKDMDALMGIIHKALEMTLLWPQLAPSDLSEETMRRALEAIDAIQSPAGLHAPAWLL